METSKFTHINEPFYCESCGKAVPARLASCRNHCPFCLVSKHVDVNPGDRANECGGLMDAVDYDLSSKKGLMLIFRCRKCRQETRNVAAHEDAECPDDYARILALKRGF